MEKKTVLLVDDVHFFLEQEKTFFNREEFNLKVARNGKEVLDILARAVPDLIVMDLYMPEMNGDECCRLIKNNTGFHHIPVIMVTIKGTDEDLKRCRDAGCDDIILKPINREHFIETTLKFLNIRDRAAPRYGARLRIHYGRNPGDLISEYTINLSTGGLFLETNNILPVDTPLDVEFILPNSDKIIRCKSRVAWVNHPELIKSPHLPIGMGLQFTGLTLEQMDSIRQFIKEQNLQPSW